MIEFRRLWHNKKIRIGLALISVLCLYNVRVGIVNYKAYIEESNQFQNCEKLVASSHQNYTQYATTGIRLLWKWSPLNIFFDSKGMKKTYATIDSTERIEISDSRRFEYRKKRSRLFNSFSDIINIIGSLLYLYFGFTAINNKDYIRFLRKRGLVIASVFHRAVLLILFGISLFLVSLLMVRLCGIVFSWVELKIYLVYMLYTIIFLMVYFVLGIICAFLLWSKKLVAMTLIILFFAVGFVPDLFDKNKSDSAESVHIAKISNLSKFEKGVTDFFEKRKDLSYEEKVNISRQLIDGYMKNGYKENENYEKNNLEKSGKKSKNEESLYIFLPSLFMYYLADELSANGSDDYIRYFNEVLRIRLKFISYINEQRLKGEKTVHPLQLDYFYMQKPVLPESFKTSLIIMLVYLMLMTGFVLRFSGKFLRKAGEKKEFPDWAGKIEPEKLNYKKFKDSGLLKESYATLTNGDASGLEENQKFLYQFLNIPIKAVYKYLSRLIKINEKKMTHILSLFDIQIDKPLTEKNIFPFYIAFVLSQDSKILVINDFLGNMSYSFYEKFEEALKYILENGKTILFLSLKSFKLRSEDKFLDDEDIKTIDLIYQSLR